MCKQQFLQNWVELFTFNFILLCLAGVRDSTDPCSIACGCAAGELLWSGGGQSLEVFCVSLFAMGTFNEDWHSVATSSHLTTSWGCGGGWQGEIMQGLFLTN